MIASPKVAIITEKHKTWHKVFIESKLISFKKHFVFQNINFSNIFVINSYNSSIWQKSFLQEKSLRMSGPGWSWTFYPKLQIPDPGFKVLIPGSWPFDLGSQVLCFELQDLGVRQFNNSSATVITKFGSCYNVRQKITTKCDRYCKLRHLLQSEMKPMITK